MLCPFFGLSASQERTRAKGSIGNGIGLLLLSAILTRAALVPRETLEAAGKVADTFAERDAVAAFLSAVVAGVKCRC